ncbi:hypothetical protein Javan37_0044 [Streptococcus phage Javan37]|nr:hypothetical protein Javan37_0044 [Streptococcus phage Javan37]
MLISDFHFTENPKIGKPFLLKIHFTENPKVGKPVTNKY